MAAAADVISSPEESLRCRERAVQLRLGRQGLRFDPTRGGDPEPLTTVHRRARRLCSASGSASSTSIASTATTIPCSAAGNSSFASAPTTPSATSCRWTASKALCPAQGHTPGPRPPEDHKDTRHFLASGPDSPLLGGRRAWQPSTSASPSGRSAYSSLMRLRFSVHDRLPAPRGVHRPGIAQYQRELPTPGRFSPTAGPEHTLKTVGRWVKVREDHQDRVRSHDNGPSTSGSPEPRSERSGSVGRRHPRSDRRAPGGLEARRPHHPLRSMFERAATPGP